MVKTKAEFSQRIAIIDYGMGNLHSVAKALQKVSVSEGRATAEIIVTSQAKVIAGADKVVLPGVGAFGDCMHNLRSYQLESVIQEVIAAGKPFLGICLGLQLLFAGSEEAPGIKGLNVFPGMVRKIVAPELKIPHMGWNSLEYKTASPLFHDLPAGAYVYFVHSFHAVPEDLSLITAVADYGGPVTAAVGMGKIQAVQFHPEKSSSIGMQILHNFMQTV